MAFETRSVFGSTQAPVSVPPAGWAKSQLAAGVQASLTLADSTIRILPGTYATDAAALAAIDANSDPVGVYYLADDGA